MSFIPPSHKEDVFARLDYYLNIEYYKVVAAAERLLVGESAVVEFEGMKGVFKTDDFVQEISFKDWKGTFRIESEGNKIEITRID